MHHLVVIPVPDKTFLLEFSCLCYELRDYLILFILFHDVITVLFVLTEIKVHTNKQKKLCFACIKLNFLVPKSDQNVWAGEEEVYKVIHAVWCGQGQSF